MMEINKKWLLDTKTTGRFGFELLIMVGISVVTYFVTALGSVMAFGLFLITSLRVNRELTKRKQAEIISEIVLERLETEQSRLKESEERFRLLVESVRDYAIFMLDPCGYVVSWNAGAERIKGYQASEIIGQHFSRFYKREDVINSKSEQTLRIAKVAGQVEEEGWRVRKDGSYFWANVVVNALRDESGYLQGFSQVVRDITDRKQAEEALQKAKDELEIRVEDRTTELRYANQLLKREVVDRQRAEQELQASQTRLKLINSLSTGMMLGMSVEQIIQRVVKQASEYFKTLRIAYSIIDAQGQLTVVHAIEREDMPQLKGLVLDLTIAPDYLSALLMNEPIIVEDVAQDLRLAPIASIMNSYGIQALINVPFQHLGNTIGLLCFDSSQLRKWSEHEIATLIGIAQYLSILIKNAYAQQERASAEKALQQAHKELEIRVKNRTSELAKSNEELRIEIIERKQAEEALRQSEERLRLAMDAAHMGTWDCNLIDKQVAWSNNYELLFGLNPGSFGETYEAFLKYIYKEDREFVADVFTKAVKWKIGFDEEFRTVWPDGSIHWLAAKGKVFCDATGRAVRMLGICMDITERKQAAEQIKASLQEKEVLLKEIHHRVKNNLQVISSLLSLQSGYVEDSQTLELLQEGQNRVASMALVHEQLYQSEDLAKIDFAEYIHNLAANLFSSYDVSSNAITLNIDIDDIYLNIDTAIPCGLIINELVSNSLKYAFKSMKTGNISIKLHVKSDHSYLLIISDNGKGLPPKLDWKNTETLGLKLVNALTRQLSGKIEIDTNSGTEFKIAFQE